MALRRLRPECVCNKNMKMRQLKSLALIGGMTAALAAVGLTGCATNSASDRSAGRMVDDNRITGLVKDGLGHEPVFKFTDVDVKTFNGVVQLSGFVTADAQKQRAGEIASRVAGVSEVLNNIALKPQPGPTPTGRIDPNPLGNYNNTPPPPAPPAPIIK